MPSRSRSVRRFRRAKREYIWTTTLLTTETVTTTRLVIPIIQPSEWQRDGVSATSFQKGATMLRIVGWIATIPFGTTTNPSTLAMMITKLDVDETPGDPHVVGDYVDEDVFWTGGNISGTTAADANSVRVQEIDIRSKRKLDSSSAIQLLMSADTAAPEWRYSLCLRGLVQLP